MYLGEGAQSVSILVFYINAHLKASSAEVPSRQDYLPINFCPCLLLCLCNGPINGIVIVVKMEAMHGSESIGTLLPV